MTDNIIEELKNNLLSLDMDNAIEKAKSIFNLKDIDMVNKTVNAISEALEEVGKKFQNGEWYLTELVFAAEITKEILNIITPLLEADSSKKLGTIVIGTVAGDLHDLGKNIFINYAKSAGFNVIDLGTDVSVDKFIQAIRENNANILGMSCLLTATDKELEKVIKKLKEEKLRNKVKVIVGGAAITEEYAKEIEADAFAPDAITGIDIIKKWSESF